MVRRSHVTDEGTYAVFALLRALCAVPGAGRLALNWYQVDEESPDRPPGARGHLDDPPAWEGLDPGALRLLRAVCDAGGSVADLAGSGILPDTAIWFTDPVPEDRASRAVWHRRALNATAGAEMVFIAPDDGLELPVFPIAARRDRRAVALDGELRDYLARGQAVICRQRRPATTWRQVLTTLGPRLEALPGAPAPLTVKLGDHGFLLLAPTPRMRRRLLTGAQAMLAGAAGGGWTHMPITVHDGMDLTLAQARAAHGSEPDGVEDAIWRDPHLAPDDRALLMDLYRRLRLPPEPPGA